MRKLYKIFIALTLCVFGVVNANAGERTPLTPDIFFAWDGWGADAQQTGPADCAYVLNESTGQPYGDPSVINYADLSLYSKLYVTCTEGTPRFLFNRTKDEGQYNENEAESYLLEYPKNGWSDRYFTKDGDTYIVDLKQMVKDKGFAHLHAIKGANWANVTVTAMELEREGKAQQVGWTELLVNGDLEGDDVTSFFSKEAPSTEVLPSVIYEGVGVDGSRGIMVQSADNPTQDWDTQFWMYFQENIPEGTKWRVSFDYRASQDGGSDTQAHAEPGDYIHYEMIGSPNFSTEWQHWTNEGVVTATQAGPNSNGGLFHSIAFNLSKNKVATQFFFDNLKFEIFKVGTVAEFSNDVILIDFGFETNMKELVQASGQKRLMYPLNCVTVKVNGEVKELYSVEGFEDGRFYIFLNEGVEPNDLVEVTFTNPGDQKYHLTYQSGPGGDVQNFTGVAEYNPEVEENDGYPYDYLTPVVMVADPEDGSFNLPNSIKEFKLKFDKDVDCGALEAKLNNESLSISPAEGNASEVTLVRNSSNDLADGEYTLHVTKIYPILRLDDSIYGDTIITINVGKVNTNPNDVPKDILPDYLASAPNGGIPEGYLVIFGEGEERVAPNTYSSGARTFDFAAGGDFTKGLYFRDNYVEYGCFTDYPLPLEAGKKYDVSFNAAGWKDNGGWMKFQILTESEEIAFETVVKTAPNVNGSTGAVNGAASFNTKFVPDFTGNYKLRWIPATNENGDQGGFNEVILANPRVKYVPNVAGIEETQLLATALENAKSTLAANSEDRYSGAAFDLLNSLIQKYEAEGPNYTAPSAYRNAAAALDAAAQALKDHRVLCDTYDALPTKAQQIVDNNAEKKFAATALYASLKEAAAKYVTKETSTVTDPETGETSEVVNYIIKVIKDDAELQAAIEELQYLVNTTDLLFTEGESKTSDTGVKVLVERLRLGAEALKSLGAGDDPLVAAANNALTDDDDLAEAIQNKLKVVLYEQLKDPNNQLFAEQVNEETLETFTPTYDMTVFVKNPNIYKQQDNMNFTEENVPGWYTPEGYNRPGLSVGWGQPRGNNEIAEDCMFQTWGGSFRVEQTVYNAPVGVYTLKIGFGERMNEDENNFVDSYIYAKTSDTLEGEDGQIGECPGIGQSFPYANASIENIVVTDGIITFGVNGGPSSHTFVNDVRLLIAAPAPYVDYGQLYQDAFTDIDGNVIKPATVRAVELYDLNGRRLVTAGKGVMIVRKYMSDGTIRVEKVVRK